MGSTKAADDFLQAVRKYYYYGYKCIGYIDEQEKQGLDTDYLGSLENLSNILQSKNIDEVFIALPTNENEITPI